MYIIVNIDDAIWGNMNGRLQYLKNRFENGMVYLVYSSGIARLAKQEDVLDMADGPIFHIHLQKQFEDFVEQFGEDQMFLPPEIQSLSGLTYRQLNHWIDRGLLTSEWQGKTRTFDTYNAFIARVLGMFRRNGASLEILEKVTRFLSEHPELPSR